MRQLLKIGQSLGSFPVRLGMILLLAGLIGCGVPFHSMASSLSQSLPVSESNASSYSSSDQINAEDLQKSVSRTLVSENERGVAASEDQKHSTEGENMMIKRIHIQIQDQNFPAELASTQAAEELYALLKQGPMTIQAHAYGGFEQVGELGRRLTAADRQIVTEPGDLVLYQSNQLVLFYGSNSWAYTRLAHVENPDLLAETLQEDKVTYTLSILDD